MRIFHNSKTAVFILAMCVFMMGATLSYSAPAPDDATMKKLLQLKQKMSKPLKSQDNIFSADLQELLKNKQGEQSKKPSAKRAVRGSKASAKAAASQDDDTEEEDGLSDVEKEERLENALREKTFQDMLKKMMPMTFDQIQRMRLKQEEVDMASRGPIGTPPKPVAISHFVSLAPGDKLPLIRMHPGFVTSVVFVDSTGAPWPVQMYSLGDPTLFNISWDKTSNMLLMQANQKFKHSNLAVKLAGMNTPVMITLVAGQALVDYRVDLRVQGLGPNAAQLKLFDGLPAKTNDMLLTLLDGVAPETSQEVTVHGGNAHAWILKKKLYLRTRMTLISPGWLSSMSSPDGMHIYEIMRTPLILVSDHGQIVQLKIEDH